MGMCEYAWCPSWEFIEHLQKSPNQSLFYVVQGENLQGDFCRADWGRTHATCINLLVRMFWQFLSHIKEKHVMVGAGCHVEMISCAFGGDHEKFVPQPKRHACAQAKRHHERKWGFRLSIYVLRMFLDLKNAISMVFLTLDTILLTDLISSAWRSHMVPWSDRCCTRAISIVASQLSTQHELSTHGRKNIRKSKTSLPFTLTSLGFLVLATQFHFMWGSSFEV